MSLQIPAAAGPEQRELPDEDTYVAIFCGYLPPQLSTKFFDKDGEPSVYTKFEYQIESDLAGDTQFAGMKLLSGALTIPKGAMGKKAYIRQHIEALMGRELEPGEDPPDVDALLGKRVQIEVELVTKTSEEYGEVT